MFDGDNIHTLPICPPEGIEWHSSKVQDLYIDDEANDDIGLTLTRIDGAHLFIHLPPSMALDIIGQCGLVKIYKALQACERLRTVSLVHSEKKRIFTDYGKQVMQACVGPQMSRNSQKDLNYPPFMEELFSHHWDSLVWLMGLMNAPIDEQICHLNMIEKRYEEIECVPLK